MPFSSARGSSRHRCTCGGDVESTYSRDLSRSPSPSSRSRSPPRRSKKPILCKECKKKKRKGGSCSPFLVIFSILNVILVILGTSLAVATIYTSRLGNPNIEDLRTYEYEFHLKRLMHGIAIGGMLAAVTGIVGLVAINPRASSSALRVAYEIMLLLSAALLLVLGALVLTAILIRKNVVDDHFRPIMAEFKYEDKPNPFNSLHRFQAEFRCCGLSKPPDPYQHLHGGPLPWSCCASFGSSTLKDPVEVQNIVDEAQKKNCTRGAAETHKTYCDQINPELGDWAFGSGIESLGVSLYCMILLATSCIARRVPDPVKIEESYNY